MTNVNITISGDLSTLGSEATAEDLDNYTANLARLVAREFHCDVDVSAASVSETRVACSDDELRERIEERVRGIESSDEWVAMIDAPSDEDGESAPVDHAARLARAAAHIDAVDLGDGGWAHHADETSSWWVVTADELEELCDYLDSEDPMIAGDAYSHWCAGCGGEEQPSWWTPDTRTVQEAAREALDAARFEGDGDDRVSVRGYHRDLAEAMAAALRARGMVVSVAPDTADSSLAWIYASEASEEVES